MVLGERTAALKPDLDLGAVLELPRVPRALEAAALHVGRASLLPVRTALTDLLLLLLLQVFHCPVAVSAIECKCGQRTRYRGGGAMCTRRPS